MVIDLGPKINFIVGHNGSGKSAILTALAICLGGKASNTQRAGSLKQFVKEGCNKSSVTIAIQNTGEEAYMPNIYGDKIIIKREFDRTNSSSYKIKSSSGNTVSSTREDLNSILDHFEIVIDNPLAILSQDAARSFLTSSTGHSLYAFLSKGINHEAMKKAQAMTAASNFETINSAKILKKEVQLKRTQFEGLKKEFESLRGQKEIGSRLLELEKQIRWKAVFVKEDTANAEQAILDKSTKKLDTLNQNIINYQDTLSQFDEKITQLIDNRTQFQGEIDKTNNEFNEQKNQERTTENLLRNSNESMKQLQNAISSTNQKIDKLERFIRKEQENIDGGYKKERDKFLAQKEGKKELFAKIEKKIEKLEVHRTEATEEIYKLTPKVNELKPELNRIMSELKNNEQSRHQVQSAEKNFLVAFGRGMTGFLDLINQNKRSFKDMPIGPIGKHITLKYTEWDSILSKIFKRSLNAFIVTNPHDKKVLFQMMSKARVSYPIIMSTPDLYEFESKMPDRQKYLVLYDALEISNEHVKRVMIDQHKIESTILVEGRAKADEIMHTNPYNVTLCYSYNNDKRRGFSLSNIGGSSSTAPIYGFPPPYMMRTSGGSQLQILEETKKELLEDQNRVSNKLNSLQKQLRDKQISEKEIGESISKFRVERSHIEREIDRIEDQLNKVVDMKRIETLQAELEIQQGELDTNTTQLEEEKSAYSDISDDLKDVREMIKQISNESKALRHKGNLLDDEVNREKREKARFSNTMQAEVQKKQKLVDSIKAKTKEVRELREMAANLESQASQMSPNRVNPIDSMETLVNKHKRTKIEFEEAKKAAGRRTLDFVSKELVEAASQYKNASAQWKVVQKTSNSIEHMRQRRDLNYAEFLKATTRNICMTFTEILQQRDFEGSLEIDHEQGVMVIKSSPKGKATAGRDTRSLSGGEKSFSQIALLLAVWSAMSCRIRGLDEFDVFMDEVNRKVSMKLMIEAIYSLDKGQTIFITPNNMADINVDKRDVKIFRLADPER